MIPDLTGSDRQGIKDFALGGGALPQHLRELGDTPTAAMTALRAKATELFAVAGLDDLPGGRRQAAMLRALMRDADWAMAGDGAIRRKGVNGRLRSSFENLRGGVDNPISSD